MRVQAPLELFLFPAVREGLSRWWPMQNFDYPWFTLGVLIATALFATISALPGQIAFGRNLATELLGPIMAIAGVFAFSWVKARAWRQPK